MIKSIHVFYKCCALKCNFNIIEAYILFAAFKKGAVTKIRKKKVNDYEGSKKSIVTEINQLISSIYEDGFVTKGSSHKKRIERHSSVD